MHVSSIAKNPVPADGPSGIAIVALPLAGVAALNGGFAPGMLPGCRPASSPPPSKGDCGLELTALQQLIHEILDPQALGRRTIREWRNLHKAFFEFFAPDGVADEIERRAWVLATRVFNTDLFAVCNGATQLVPMTYQDFADGLDSFKHDGLREGVHRDIAWQPKKVLLLMSALIGRCIAGWQADQLPNRGLREQLFPFRYYLVDENRKAGFLGHLFMYDPRFSILEYRAAGLKSLLHPVRHLAGAILDNRIERCEICGPQFAGNPPRLRLHFQQPLRTPVGSLTLLALDLVLLHKPQSPGPANRAAPGDSPYFESSETALEGLAFAAQDPLESKFAKTERLLELALTSGLLVCGPHQASAATATQLGRTLGRTSAEQWVIERYFALGFRSGHGNEPVQTQAPRETESETQELAKAVRKRFELWKETTLFFARAGRPEAATLPGARVRQEVLQSDTSRGYLALLQSPVYAPLMETMLATDTEGKWLIDEQDLRAMGRCLNAGADLVLLQGTGVLSRSVDLLPEITTKGSFLLECAAGTLLSLAGVQKNSKRLTSLGRVCEFLRHRYEGLFGVALPSPESFVAANPAAFAARQAEATLKCEASKRNILALLNEPLDHKVGPQLTAAQSALLEAESLLAMKPLSSLRLENSMVFEESVTERFAWIVSRDRRVGHPSLPNALPLSSLCEVRAMAENGKAADAVMQAAKLLGMPGSRNPDCAPFYGELAWSVLADVEWTLNDGHRDKAVALAEAAASLIPEGPSADELKALFRELFHQKPAGTATASTMAVQDVAKSSAQEARAGVAAALLREHAEELGQAENSLEREFLQAVLSGSDRAFKRKEKLKHRLERQTRWGGREPFKTALELLETINDPRL